MARMCVPDSCNEDSTAPSFCSTYVQEGGGERGGDVAVNIAHMCISHSCRSPSDTHRLSYHSPSTHRHDLRQSQLAAALHVGLLEQLLQY